MCAGALLSQSLGLISTPACTHTSNSCLYIHMKRGFNPEAPCKRSMSQSTCISMRQVSCRVEEMASLVFLTLFGGFFTHCFCVNNASLSLFYATGSHIMGNNVALVIYVTLLSHNAARNSWQDRCPWLLACMGIHKYAASKSLSIKVTCEGRSAGTFRLSILEIFLEETQGNPVNLWWRQLRR